jgi:hypothetical protein
MLARACTCWRSCINSGTWLTMVLLLSVFFLTNYMITTGVHPDPVVVAVSGSKQQQRRKELHATSHLRKGRHAPPVRVHAEVYMPTSLQARVSLSTSMVGLRRRHATESCAFDCLSRYRPSAARNKLLLILLLLLYPTQNRSGPGPVVVMWRELFEPKCAWESSDNEPSAHAQTLFLLAPVPVLVIFCYTCHVPLRTRGLRWCAC